MEEDEEIRYHTNDSTNSNTTSFVASGTNTEQQRFGFNISPPTIPRSAYDDVGHIFPTPATSIATSVSSAFSSTIAQEFRGQIPAATSSYSVRHQISTSYPTNFRTPLTSYPTRGGRSYFTPLTQTEEESKVSTFLPLSPQDVTSHLPSADPVHYRYRPDSATPSVETLGSIDESASSEFGPSRLRASSRSYRGRGRSRSTESRRSLSDLGRIVSSSPTKASPRNPDAASPLPQNLRGDPFRSAKVKTELCRNFFTEKGCPFGDKCNYAHGEEELKLTKLIDLERAGLVDIEIFRTHPCMTWISTGACPFDHRCTGLHDPRLESEQPCWLPHTETMVNKVIEDGSNVDRFYHERLASTYNCCPISGYIPLAQQTNSKDCSELSWTHFYNFICNLDLDDPVKIHSFHDRSNDIDEALKLEIVLSMRESRLGSSYSYLPSHIFNGDLCMLLQSRIYIVRKIFAHDNSSMDIIEDITKSDLLERGMVMSGRIIHVYEIAFGPVGDPTVFPVSIWFDLAEGELAPCTAQQARHHKRSRHRLKKMKRRRPSSSETSRYEEERQAHDVFDHYQPRDDATFNLITRILIHRLNTVRLYSPKYSSRIDYRTAFQVLGSELDYLKECYKSLLRFWLAFAYPEQILQEPIDENSDVPPVDSEYNCLIGPVKFHRSADICGLSARRYSYQISQIAMMLPSLLWKSFILNLSLNKEDQKTMEKLKSSSKLSFEFNRLQVFQHLSKGGNICKDRGLYKLSRDQHMRYQEKFIQVHDTWEQIKRYYDENPDSSSMKVPGIAAKSSGIDVYED